MSATTSLQEITGFALVTADLPRLTGFYRDVLGFAVHGGVQPVNPAEMSLLGLRGSGRRQVLGMGDQTVSLDCFDASGRTYPMGGDAASLWFQHLAIVVADIAVAHARLRNIVPISDGGPQQLPASSGSVQAFKFRDPDGHPLEFLQFPPDGAPDPWRGRQPQAGQIGLGIDHSAISVANADASVAFYRALGLGPGARTLNHGITQQHLDGLRDVEVEVVPMLPPHGVPHLELLGYQVPGGARGPARQANDIAATRIVWHGSETRLLVDPDGHLQQVRA